MFPLSQRVTTFGSNLSSMRERGSLDRLGRNRRNHNPASPSQAISLGPNLIRRGSPRNFFRVSASRSVASNVSSTCTLRRTPVRLPPKRAPGPALPSVATDRAPEPAPAAATATAPALAPPASPPRPPSRPPGSARSGSAPARWPLGRTRARGQQAARDAIRPSWIEIDGATLAVAWGWPNARKRSWQRGDVGFVCSSGTTSREGAPARLILVTDKSHGEAVTATIVCDGFSYEAYATHARSEPHYHAASRDRSGFRSGRDGTAESPDAACPRGRGGAVARSADGARCRRPVHLAVLGADRRTGDVGAALPRPHHRTIRSGILRVVHRVLTEPPATARPRVSARRRRCRSGGRAERMRSR